MTFFPLSCAIRSPKTGAKAAAPLTPLNARQSNVATSTIWHISIIAALLGI